MLQKAKSSRRTPGGGDKAWASEAAVEGIKRLRQEVVTLLRALLVTLRQNDTQTLTPLLTKLQDKTRSLLNVIEPSLVEEAFEFLDQIRVPQNPSRMLTLATRTYSNYNISGYLSPETALDLELMSPDTPGLPKCGNPEHRQSEERTCSGMKDMDIMDGQENSIYRPTDEPEPWDLIQLNVQASIMCLTSKLKTYCSRVNESREKEMSESVSGELPNEPQSQEGDSKQQDDNTIESPNDGTDATQSQGCVTEAQNITSSLAAQTQAMISSSVGSDSSHASGKSMSSSLGATRNESQRSSCSATPDESPCEEDSGIGLERVTSEVERTDCISDGGLSVEEERREELLPLDKTEVKRGERDEQVVNSDVRYGSDTSVIKSSKLESIMEQSIEDLGPSLEGEGKSNKVSSDGATLCPENGTVSEKESEMNDRNLSVNGNGEQEITHEHNGEENDNKLNATDETKGEKIESKGKESSEITSCSEKLQNHKGGSTEEEVDWVAEVRPSMKKLRQAMDGLMRTARLVHSVFRLQQTPEAAQQAHNIKYRRDICFSQALTSLVTGLMTRLWCRKADPLFVTVLAHLGPLAEFECLVSCHGWVILVVLVS
ncbi:Type II inositol 3,4-bisphosphate 4-phosphatase [Chionoecetes opilio]|uniref:Type II inositol 3,4-bisphosphate 4-phosphatase n=1 Tax=Chionoecetes opilio TaxID=41210 RepID=A0A8J4Y8X5_CHIOP|nr:Type II inositol 3,4-bisphosphate 4-phosphatase [Chionoecetes opilio]